MKSSWLLWRNIYQVGFILLHWATGNFSVNVEQTAIVMPVHIEVSVLCVLSGRLGKCDPELISTVMEFCLQMRCRSSPIFEAVAENFVRNAETHTTIQIAKQIVAMGRLNYLPQVFIMS